MNPDTIRVIYFDIENENLQFFFTIMAYIENSSTDAVFSYDSKNVLVLQEVAKILDFKLVKRKIKNTNEIKVIITADHSTPKTKIGNLIEAPLIFPRLIMDRFFKDFESKHQKVYFRGFFTRTRYRESIKFFIEIKDFNALYQILKKTFAAKFLKNTSFIISTSKVYFNFTARGRDPQYKYMDFDYYEEMANYKIIFCPKGDFIWTYRFFEAIQVGSIPYCKYYTSSYEGFKYLNKIDNTSVKQENVIAINLSKLKNQFFIKSLQDRLNDSIS
ncbi:hypothetical protein C9994_05750 [Marivirga lumbricoides]|uniref:Uncharacterized protein n=1 Tax=Marivirga lumbricoides TaxID=1046115 RepID=A0A2T4DSY1_9BACT|nr:hypothetical protein C9994_05750 [Marivirga lumbricoides]